MMDRLNAEQRAERVRALQRGLAMAETECGKPKKLSLTGTPLTLNEKKNPNGVKETIRKYEAREMKKQHHQKVMFDTAIAVEAQDMVAGVTDEDIACGEFLAEALDSLSHVARSNARRFVFKRTEVINKIPNVIYNGMGSELARQISAEMHDPNRKIKERERRIYNAAFPDYDKKKEGKTVMCTPLGARLILNWIAIFGSEPFISGTPDLTELIDYASIPQNWGSFELKQMIEEEETLTCVDDEKVQYRQRDPNESSDRSAFKYQLLNDQRFTAVCPLTKISDKRFLIASHIKPYAACENRFEKTDRDNGFLLSPNADALFDKGYISFNDEGVMMLSPKQGINGALLSKLGVDQKATVPIKSERTREYLAYHREFVFERDLKKEQK